MKLTHLRTIVVAFVGVVVIFGSFGFSCLGPLELSLDSSLDGGPSAPDGGPTPNTDVGIATIGDEKAAAWFNVLEHGGTLDYDGDGLVDLEVTISGNGTTIKSFQLGALSDVAQFTDGLLVAETEDTNMDGYFDSFRDVKYFAMHVVDTSIWMDEAGEHRLVFDDDQSARMLSVVHYVAVADASGNRVETLLYRNSFSDTLADNASAEGSCSKSDYVPEMESGKSDQGIGPAIALRALKGNLAIVTAAPADLRAQNVAGPAPAWACTEAEIATYGRALNDIFSLGTKCLFQINQSWLKDLMSSIQNDRIRLDCGKPCADPSNTVRGGEEEFMRETNQGRKEITKSISIRKEFFAPGNFQNLVEALLHELLHAARHPHQAPFGENVIDHREVAEGRGVDQVYACGNFCGAGSPRLGAFLTNDSSRSSGDYLTLAQECSRCASPSARIKCGSKIIYDVPVGEQLTVLDDYQRGDAKALSCKSADSANAALASYIAPGSPYSQIPLESLVCYDFAGGTNYRCDIGHFWTNISCDDRYFPNLAPPTPVIPPAQMKVDEVPRNLTMEDSHPSRTLMCAQCSTGYFHGAYNADEQEQAAFSPQCIANMNTFAFQQNWCSKPVSRDVNVYNYCPRRGTTRQ
jgi:hypothetical protein